MKKLFRILSLACLALLLFGLAGCSKYVSKYSAVGFVHSNSARSAFMNFHQFEGTMVFKLKAPGGQAAQLDYSARLESGSAIVYLDAAGTKIELFSLRGGDEIAASAAQINGEKTIYVIVETDGKCENGELYFDLNAPGGP